MKNRATEEEDHRKKKSEEKQMRDDDKRLKVLEIFDSCVEEFKIREFYRGPNI